MFFYIFLFINVLKCMPPRFAQEQAKVETELKIFNSILLQVFVKIFASSINSSCDIRDFFSDKLNKNNESMAVICEIRSNDLTFDVKIFEFFCVQFYSNMFQITQFLAQNAQEILTFTQLPPVKQLYFHEGTISFQKPAGCSVLNSFAFIIRVKIGNQDEQKFILEFCFPMPAKIENKILLSQISRFNQIQDKFRSINFFCSQIFCDSKIYSQMFCKNKANVAVQEVPLVPENLHNCFLTQLNYAQGCLEALSKNEIILRRFNCFVAKQTLPKIRLVIIQGIESLFYINIFFGENGNLVSQERFNLEKKEDSIVFSLVVKACINSEKNNGTVFLKGETSVIILIHFIIPISQTVLADSKSSKPLSRKKKDELQRQKELEQQQLFVNLSNNSDLPNAAIAKESNLRNNSDSKTQPNNENSSKAASAATENNEIFPPLIQEELELRMLLAKNDLTREEKLRVIELSKQFNWTLGDLNDFEKKQLAKFNSQFLQDVDD